MNEQSLPVEVVKNETSAVTSVMNKERIKKAQTFLKKYKGIAQDLGLYG